MKKLTLLLMLSFISMASFAQKKPKIKGDKNVTTIANNIIKEFTAIEIADELKVTLVPGLLNNYTLTSDKNLQSVIEFKVEEGVLRIYSTSQITGSKKLEIKVVFRSLDKIDLMNDAQVKVEGTLESNSLFINADNSSKFDLEVKTKDVSINMLGNAKGKLKAHTDNTVIVMIDKSDLNADITTNKMSVDLTKSAKLELRGNSDDLTFKATDSSEMDAKKMKVSSANLNVSSNAKVHVDVKKNLSIFAKDKSSIYLYSEPKINIEKLADKSEILKR